MIVRSGRQLSMTNRSRNNQSLGLVLGPNGNSNANNPSTTSNVNNGQSANSFGKGVVSTTAPEARDSIPGSSRLMVSQVSSLVSTGPNQASVSSGPISYQGSILASVRPILGQVTTSINMSSPTSPLVQQPPTMGVLRLGFIPNMGYAQGTRDSPYAKPTSLIVGGGTYPSM